LTCETSKICPRPAKFCEQPLCGFACLNLFATILQVRQTPRMGGAKRTHHARQFLFLMWPLRGCGGCHYVTTLARHIALVRRCGGGWPVFLGGRYGAGQSPWWIMAQSASLPVQW